MVRVCTNIFACASATASTPERIQNKTPGLPLRKLHRLTPKQDRTAIEVGRTSHNQAAPRGGREGAEDLEKYEASCLPPTRGFRVFGPGNINSQCKASHGSSCRAIGSYLINGHALAGLPELSVSVYVSFARCGQVLLVLDYTGKADALRDSHISRDLRGLCFRDVVTARGCK